MSHKLKQIFGSRNNIAIGVLIMFALAGLAFLVSSRAFTPSISAEPEQGTVSSPASTISDTSASGGQAVKFTAAPVLSPGWNLTRSWYEANTGPRVALAATQPSKSIIVTNAGSIIEKKNVTGNITVKANNVTIRDNYIRSSQINPITVDAGVTGTLIEYNDVDGLNTIRPRGRQAGINTQDTNKGVIIKNNKVRGNHDAIKVVGNTRVEYNYIYNNQRGSSQVHVDGIQTPGKSTSNSTFYRNWIDTPVAKGSNSSIISEVLSGPVSNVRIEENYLNGGNYTLYVFTDRTAGAYGCPKNISILNNKFGRDYRYGLYFFYNAANNTRCDTTANGWVHKGSVWFDTGAAAIDPGLFKN